MTQQPQQQPGRPWSQAGPPPGWNQQGPSPQRPQQGPPPGWRPQPPSGPPPGWQQQQQGPLMRFDSHVAGKNAVVTVWPNRIEWEQGSHMGTGAKVALGAATLGASVLATGVRGRRDTQMILMKSIHGVTTAKSGLTKTSVNVATSGGVIAFRCSGSEAQQFQQTLLSLIG